MVKYAILNKATEEWFSHFTEWEGRPHANWTKSKIQTYDDFSKATKKQKEILNQCFIDTKVFAISLVEDGDMKMGKTITSKKNGLLKQLCGHKSLAEDETVSFGRLAGYQPYVEFKERGLLWFIDWEELIEMACSQVIEGVDSGN